MEAAGEPNMLYSGLLPVVFCFASVQFARRRKTVMCTWQRHEGKIKTSLESSHRKTSKSPHTIQTKREKRLDRIWGIGAAGREIDADEGGGPPPGGKFLGCSGISYFFYRFWFLGSGYCVFAHRKFLGCSEISYFFIGFGFWVLRFCSIFCVFDVGLYLLVAQFSWHITGLCCVFSSALS